MGAIDFDRLERLALEASSSFARAQPFPHIAIDDFLRHDVAEQVADEFDTVGEGWDHYVHYNEDKHALTRLDAMPPRTREVLDELLSDRFVEFVAKLSGLDRLVSDPQLDGAGLHRVKRGGFLNVHTDFLSHTRHHDWLRAVNLLLYFNRDWSDDWDGGLELWDADMQNCVTTLQPTFNRCVLFRTTATSYHGHPRPLSCPEGVERRAIALYYFRVEDEVQPLSSTHYRPVPSDPLHRKVLIAADRSVVRAYSFIRRHTGLSDDAVSRTLDKLFRRDRR